MRFLLLLSALLIISSCGGNLPQEDVKVPSPKLLSSVPADGAEDVKSGDVELVLTFDKNVKCGSGTGGFSIDGDALIDRVNAYNENVTVYLKNIQANARYTLSVAEGVISGFKQNEEVMPAFSVSFSTEKREIPKDYTLNPVPTLVNPSASVQAKKLYEFLVKESGSKMLSGVMSGTSNTNDHLDKVYSVTGSHPALSGYDFLFLHYSPTPSDWTWVQNYNDISAAKSHWEAGGVVSYMWHWNVPSDEAAWKAGKENYNFDNYAFYSNKTKFDIKRALTPGTWENEFMLKDIEEAASYLKLLADANIPVIWRPLHEAAGNYDIYGPDGAWFWWGRGGAESCKQLWKLLYEKLVNEYKLNNLIWVWTLDATPGAEDQYAAWYPGDDYVDIVGVDIYEDNTNAKTRQCQAAVNLTKGRKLVTISECGNIPNPDKCKAEGNRWSWFMVWPSDEGYPLNTNVYLNSVMKSSSVYTRENMPKLK